jgi:hypothetical protein
VNSLVSSFFKLICQALCQGYAGLERLDGQGSHSFVLWKKLLKLDGVLPRVFGGALSSEVPSGWTLRWGVEKEGISDRSRGNFSTECSNCLGGSGDGEPVCAASVGRTQPSTLGEGSGNQGPWKKGTQARVKPDAHNHSRVFSASTRAAAADMDM